MKKILAIVLAAVMCFALASCGCDTNKADYTVGIVQFVQHDALDQATKGFQDALTAKMTEAGKTVTFDLQNASGDTNQCSTISNKFVADNVDLIMANATPALQAAFAATTNIPILATSVTEYGVALDIENFNGVTGTNVSGTSDLAPLDMQAQMILDLVPTAKTVGLLYCSAEANSLYQVKVVQAYLEGKGITCNSYPFENSNELSQIALNAAAQCDAIYVPTDNTVASNASLIAAACYPDGGKQVPVVAGEAGICTECGIATLSIDYYKLGVKTGEMAAEILLNGGDITKMPIQYDEEVVYKYNPEFCKKAGIVVPEGYVALGEDAPAEEAASEPASETVSE